MAKIKNIGGVASMRKFLIFVAFIICFIMVGFCRYDAVNFTLDGCANPKYYFYVQLSEDVADSHYTKNGEGGIIALNQSELELLSSFNVVKMYGKSVEFECKDSEFGGVVKSLGANIVKEECYNSFKTIYGYNAKFGKSVTLFGKEVNVQVAKRGDVVSVGFPILLGSY